MVTSTSMLTTRWARIWEPTALASPLRAKTKAKPRYGSTGRYQYEGTPQDSRPNLIKIGMAVVGLCLVVVSLQQTSGL